ncbi:hypothetical protein BGZ72_000233 [Mortierella alpina]|nr:hypothetical protein BGZ72_000233 [Mortierella alpina]
MQGGSGADRAMGLFINTLPLRVDVENSTVLESVRKVQTDLATLLEHEHASLALAQRCSSIPSGSPLFSAILNYRHNIGLPEQAELNTGMELLDGQERSSYPFVMSVEDFGTSLGVTAQIVEPHDSLGICGYMQQALFSLAYALEKSPESPVHALNILSSEERDLMVRVWNTTDADFPADKRIHQMFEDHAVLSPEAIALVHDNQSLTYNELNMRANVLAHRLIESDVKHGDFVAVLLHRSFDLVTAQLAILKVGGAYVPIDPKAPVDRQAFIVKDSASNLLITDAHMGIPSALQVQLLRLDSGSAPFTERANVTLTGSSQDTAYAMYTSGSTGVPKGCAVIIDADTFTDSHLLAKALERHHINTLWLTMALFNQYVLSIGPALAKLKYLLCGGEQGNLETFAALLKHGGPENLINGYGPTETTTFATTFNASRVVSQFDRLPIGRPIGNTQVYVLDKHCNLVPLGAIGELYIGGAGVATGYLNQPGLTAEKFLPDPFSEDEGARMYRTGDLVRYLPDGNLVFMGRNDEQVKIRGFRIELGEIEARLVEHELVNEAVVLALENGGDKRLVAYVVADHNEDLVHTLREYLTKRMPEYMIPAAFVRLDSLPVTNNGKVNRRALPEPDVSAFAATSYEAPKGDVESGLAEIWAELLSLDRVGRHDNFFMLGGHSLLAVRMTGSIRSRLGLDLKLHTLFAAPTVADLAQKLLQEASSEDDEYSVLFPLKTSGTRPPLFCIHSGIGLSWPYIGLVKHLHPDQPVYGIQARGLDGKTKLATSVEEMTEDYIEHIRRIQPHGPYHLLGWSFGGTVAHSMATELEKQGEQVPLLVIMDSTADYSIVADVQIDDSEGDDANIEHLIRFGGDFSAEDASTMWERTKPINKNSFVLGMKFQPSVYSGDILFFNARIKEDELTPIVDPLSWSPYLKGAIEVHEIECTHVEMDKPEPMTIIGQAVASKLERVL